MLRSYKYRIYPTDEQKILLAKHFGCVRWMYNYGLSEKTKAFKDKAKLSCIDIANRIADLKVAPETAWLKEVNSQSLQASLRNLDNAYTKFFREKKGFPRFKSKGDNHQSFQCPQHCSVDFTLGRIHIPKFKLGIRAVLHREFNGEIRTVTISKNCANQYFSAVLVDDKKMLVPPMPVKNAVGIDLGLKDFAVLSDGRKFENPKFYAKTAFKLARLQKLFSRKVKGSRNRDKSRIKVAKCHLSIANQRKDFLHKLSRELVNDSQVDTFCLETLNPKGMMANRKLAKSIGDASWSSFVSFLTYKAEWAGKNVIKIGRFEPSSKVCSSCGSIKPMPLNLRTYECKCGYVEDRDTNAAKNIRNYALSMNRNSGEDFACKSVEVSKVKGRKAKKLRLVRENEPQRTVEAEKSGREARSPYALA